MSTTIQYKGSTLATVSNDTKTLKTAGKYMEGDVVLTDVSGGSVTQDQDGFIVLPPTGGGSPSVGGLEYETGTWTPSEDVASYVIPFTNTHTTAPFYYTISDATGTYSSDLASTNYGVIYVCWNQIFGAPMYSTSSQIWYGRSNYLYRGTSATAAISAGVSSFTHSESETGTSDVYPTYWATETGIKAYTNSSSRYWRANRTYKWIAVWKPTT